MRLTINKKEFEAICSAQEYVNNILEGCSDDDDSESIRQLNKTITGLDSICRKYKRPKRLSKRKIDAIIKSLPSNQ